MPTILVVDDSRTTQLLVISVLRRIPAAVLLAAADGREALEVLAKNEVDLLVTDFDMPEMDGLALVRAARRTRNADRMPIIMVTAKAEVKAREEGLAAGANAYVLKPISTQHLYKVAETLLAKSQRHLGAR